MLVFFSEGNVALLRSEEIQFMIRPSNRKLYKDLIDKNQDLESIKHAIVYGGRGLFIKKCMVDLFGKNASAYVYWILTGEGGKQGGCFSS